MPVQEYRFLDSLKEILGESPGAQIFVTGRTHILAEIGAHLAGLVYLLVLAEIIL